MYASISPFTTSVYPASLPLLQYKWVAQRRNEEALELAHKDVSSEDHGKHHEYRRFIIALIRPFSSLATHTLRLKAWHISMDMSMDISMDISVEINMAHK